MFIVLFLFWVVFILVVIMAIISRKRSLILISLAIYFILFFVIWYFYVRLSNPRNRTPRITPCSVSTGAIYASLWPVWFPLLAAKH